jgi:hypothetical protein
VLLGEPQGAPPLAGDAVVLDEALRRQVVDHRRRDVQHLGNLFDGEECFHLYKPEVALAAIRRS